MAPPLSPWGLRKVIWVGSRRPAQHKARRRGSEGGEDASARQAAGQSWAGERPSRCWADRPGVCTFSCRVTGLKASYQGICAAVACRPAKQRWKEEAAVKKNLLWGKGWRQQNKGLTLRSALARGLSLRVTAELLRVRGCGGNAR